MKADKAVSGVKQAASSVVKAVKNEILDIIRAVAERNYNRLKRPVTLGEYIRLISDREPLHDRAGMEKFVHNMGWTTFEDMEKYWSEEVIRFETYKKDSEAKWERKCYLEELMEAYEKYEPYIKYDKERWTLKGFQGRFMSVSIYRSLKVTFHSVLDKHTLTVSFLFTEKTENNEK